MNRLREAAERSYRTGDGTVATICVANQDTHIQIHVFTSFLSSYTDKITVSNFCLSVSSYN